MAINFGLEQFVIDNWFKNRRAKFSDDQNAALEAEFRGNKQPDKARRAGLATSLGFEPVVVDNWFKNRRAKEKK